jgi:murein DD-endopeptidase MepM/ murein hydrolase activator NlpD
MAAVLAPLAVPSTALAERWLRPVPGEVARSFSYDRAAPFTAGAHRGADLAAPPRTAVRAACAGRVVHAGPVAGWSRVVSMSCRGRRVSYLPLATVAVAEDAVLRAGATIGTVAPGHGGLHIGVRRESDPFGYEDPMALLPPPDRPFTPAPRPKPPRTAPRSSPLPRVARRRALPRSSPLPRAARRPALPRSWPLPSTPRVAPRPRAAPPPTARPAPAASPAPLPVWGGLAALVCGAAGSGTVAARRRRIARARAPVVVEPA